MGDTNPLLLGEKLQIYEIPPTADCHAGDGGLVRLHLFLSYHLDYLLLLFLVKELFF